LRCETSNRSIVPAGAERRRVERAIRTATAGLELDLTGIGVLTEAASGAFSVTAIMAALAGADPVIAVCRDSKFGRADEVIAAMRDWAQELGLSGRLVFQFGRPELGGRAISLVTNLGFVRPIESSIVQELAADAVVCLMWEPWEYRSKDIDLAACREHNVPVVATCESHPRLRTYDYLAFVAARLLLENGIGIFGSNILVVGSDPFGSAIVEGLQAMQASVKRIDPTLVEPALAYSRFKVPIDAIVIAEHRDTRPVLGGTSGIDPRHLMKQGTVVAHICGAVDREAVLHSGLSIIPDDPAPPGKMSFTTAYVGPRPVIELHAGGLKVGEIVVRQRRQGRTTDEAISAAVASGLGLRLHG
jgi:hypothetical protein